MNKVFLYRSSRETHNEEQTLREMVGENTSYKVASYRSEVKEGDLVIGRYSVLPMYREVASEIHYLGGHLINSIQEHEWIAQMGWYYPLKHLTPTTWFCGYSLVPDTEHGYVVKGKTNSRKFQWKTHMYAPDKDYLKSVVKRVYDDQFLSDQGLVIREFVPLQTLEEGLNGLPVTNEWRCFFYKNQLLASGYYWAQAEHAMKYHMEGLPPEGLDIAQQAADIAQDYATFFVIDVGQTQKGEWVVIEVNDGQMSGLSMVESTTLYQNLIKALNEDSHE